MDHLDTEVQRQREHEDFVGRIIDEGLALEQKIDKLEAFLTTPVFNGLEQEAQDLLHEQLKHMQAYNDVLVRRLRQLGVEI